MFKFEKEKREDLIRALSVCKYKATVKNDLQDTNPEDKDGVESCHSAVPVNNSKHLENNGDYEDKFEEDTGSMVLRSEMYEQKGVFTGCVQGMSNDRTFVIMGNNILVHSSHCEVPNSLEYLTTFPVISEYQNFTPRNPILHDGEKSLLMIGETKTGSAVYRMDLEAGKVVEEYKSNEVRQITHLNKNAQTTTEKVFLGINDSGPCLYDTRLRNQQLLYS
jgi:hypothetical protein